MWYTKFGQSTVEVVEPHISDHSPLRVTLRQPSIQKPRMFKFLNCAIELEAFIPKVEECWKNNIVRGRPMDALWRKLSVMKGVVKGMTNKFANTDLKMNQEFDKACDSNWVTIRHQV